jgi:hypothetical protein
MSSSLASQTGIDDNDRVPILHNNYEAKNDSMNDGSSLYNDECQSILSNDEGQLSVEVFPSSTLPRFTPGCIPQLDWRNQECVEWLATIFLKACAVIHTAAECRDAAKRFEGDGRRIWRIKSFEWTETFEELWFGLEAERCLRVFVRTRREGLDFLKDWKRVPAMQTVKGMAGWGMSEEDLMTKSTMIEFYTKRRDFTGLWFER